MFEVFPLLFFFLFVHGALAGVNETVDNTDPGILYQPSYKWKTYEDSSCTGGSYAMGHDSCANATIQCNWISFYYSSPLWPYPISTTISIDGNDPVVVDLQDYSAAVSEGGSSTVASKVVYSYQGSSSQLHTILISGSDQYPFSVVDSLIFETTDGSGCSGYRPCPGGYQYCPPNSGTTITITGTTTTTTTTTTSTSTSAPITLTTTLLATTTVGTLTIDKTITETATTTTTYIPGSRNSDVNIVVYYKHKNHALTIGIAILAVCIGLLFCLLCFLLWRRYRRRHAPVPPPVKPSYGSTHGSRTSVDQPPERPTYGAQGGGGGASYGAGGGGASYGAGGGAGGAGGYGAGSAA